MLNINLRDTTKYVKGKFATYVRAILIGHGKKTCTNMAAFIGCCHDTLNRCLHDSYDISTFVQTFAIDAIKFFTQIETGYLIADTSLFCKRFATSMEAVRLVFDHVLKRYDRSLTIVLLVWSNGKFLIPIGFRWCITKPKDKGHKTRLDLTRELIAEAIAKDIPFDYFLGDAAFCSENMINFLNQNGVNFEMRIPCNRKVDYNGSKIRLDKLPVLKLRRNLRSKTALIVWHEIKLYITLFKKRGHYGDYDYIFTASNTQLSTHEHIERYGNRQKIETFIRAIKQMGAADCVARSISCQSKHVLAILHLYTITQAYKNQNNFEVAERAAEDLQTVKIDQLEAIICCPNLLFG